MHFKSPQSDCSSLSTALPQTLGRYTPDPQLAPHDLPETASRPDRTAAPALPGGP